MGHIQIVRYATANDFGFADQKETKAPAIISGHELQKLIGGKKLGHSLQWGEHNNRVAELRIPFTDYSSIAFIGDWMATGPRLVYLPSAF